MATIAGLLSSSNKTQCIFNDVLKSRKMLETATESIMGINSGAFNKFVADDEKRIRKFQATVSSFVGSMNRSPISMTSEASFFSTKKGLTSQVSSGKILNSLCDPQSSTKSFHSNDVTFSLSKQNIYRSDGENFSDHFSWGQYITSCSVPSSNEQIETFTKKRKRKSKNNDEVIFPKKRKLDKRKKASFEALLMALDTLILEEIGNKIELDKPAETDFNLAHKTDQRSIYLWEIRKRLKLLKTHTSLKRQSKVINAIHDRFPGTANLSKQVIDQTFSEMNKIYSNEF